MLCFIILYVLIFPFALAVHLVEREHSARQVRPHSVINRHFAPPLAAGFLNRTATPPTKIRASSWRLPVRLQHWHTGRNARSYSPEVHTISVAAGTHRSSIIFLCPSDVSTANAYTFCLGMPFSMPARHPLPRASPRGRSRHSASNKYR